MDPQAVISLTISLGTAVATWYFWAVKMNEEAPSLDAAWLSAGKPAVRGNDAGKWLGLECRTVVTNLSKMPNVLLRAEAEVRLADGRWGHQPPPRELVVGSPTALPLEMPAGEASEVKLWVWVRVPAGAAAEPRGCLSWPPALRVTLDALDGKRFVLELPLAEEA